MVMLSHDVNTMMLSISDNIVTLPYTVIIIWLLHAVNIGYVVILFVSIVTCGHQCLC